MNRRTFIGSIALGGGVLSSIGSSQALDTNWPVVDDPGGGVVRHPGRQVDSFKISQNREYLLLMNYQYLEVYVYDIETWEIVAKIKEPSDPTDLSIRLSVEFSPDTSLFLFVSDERDGPNINVYETDSWTKIASFEDDLAQNLTAWRGKFSPQGNYIVLWTYDYLTYNSKIYIYEVGSWNEPVQEFGQSSNEPYFTEDEEYFIWDRAGEDILGDVRIHETNSWSQVKILDGDPRLNLKRLSPNGTYLVCDTNEGAAVSDDKGEQKWYKIGSWELVESMRERGKFSPDENYFVQGNKGYNTRDTDFKHEVYELDANGFKFSPNGKYVLTKADSQIQSIYETGSWERRKLRATEERYYEDLVKFSHDSKYLYINDYSSDDENKYRIYSLTGRNHQLIPPNTEATYRGEEGAFFTEDPQQLIMLSEDDDIWIHRPYLPNFGNSVASGTNQIYYSDTDPVTNRVEGS